MGGKSSTSNQSNPVTNNNDKRLAVSDGAGITGDGSSITQIDNSNSSDAVIAMTNAGADIIKSSGGAVVELAKFQGEQNTDAWNTTLTTSAKLVDKLIDKASEGFALSSKVVDSFQPTENKNVDAIKYAAIAAGVVGVAALWGKQK